MEKKTLRMVFSLMFAVTVLMIQTLAVNVVDNPTYDPQSVNRTFDLDFEESQSWYTVDFSNWAMINHNNVSLKYNRYTPSGTVNGDVYVLVDLYIDEEGDGTFVRYKTDGSYVQELLAGGTLQYSLPKGMQECHYKLRITNGNEDVLAGNFTLKTFYNSVS